MAANENVQVAALCILDVDDDILVPKQIPTPRARLRLLLFAVRQRAIDVVPTHLQGDDVVFKRDFSHQIAIRERGVVHLVGANAARVVQAQVALALVTKNRRKERAESGLLLTHVQTRERKQPETLGVFVQG